MLGGREERVRGRGVYSFTTPPGNEAPAPLAPPPNKTLTSLRPIINCDDKLSTTWILAFSITASDDRFGAATATLDDAGRCRQSPCKEKSSTH